MPLFLSGHGLVESKAWLMRSSPHLQGRSSPVDHPIEGVWSTAKVSARVRVRAYRIRQFCIADAQVGFRWESDHAEKEKKARPAKIAVASTMMPRRRKRLADCAGTVMVEAWGVHRRLTNRA